MICEARGGNWEDLTLILKSFEAMPIDEVEWVDKLIDLL